jgi:transcriptional regulator with XRE-family HTH domain
MIGKRIEELRNHLKLNQTKFGERIGVSQAAISHIEKGDTVPSEQTIVFICTVYPVNREWLEKGRGPMFYLESQPRDKLAEDPASDEILRIFRGIDEVHREKILVFARDMRDYFNIISRQLPKKYPKKKSKTVI